MARATRACSRSRRSGPADLVIGSPKDEQELRDLVVTALPHDGPISLHYPRDAGEVLRSPGEPLEIGRAEVLREGSDLLLVGFGPIVQRLLASSPATWRAARPDVHGDQRPMGEATRRAFSWPSHAAGKRLVVTAEESAAMGGFGDGGSTR